MMCNKHRRRNYEKCDLDCRRKRGFMSKWYEKSDWEKEVENEEAKGIIKVVLLSTIGVIALLVALTFIFGWFGVGYTKTVEKAQINANREVFKVSKPYVEGMVSDLAKYKYELTTEKDSTARKAIIDLIIDKYGNFDESKIENVSLRNFLINIKNGGEK